MDHRFPATTFAVALALLAASLLAPALAQPASGAADPDAAGRDPPPSAGRASSGPVEVTALAVTQTERGLEGVHAKVRATALAGGTGQVFVATKPLAQTDMQGSARLASQVAAATLGADWRRYDFLVEFTSDSPIVGGPSAGTVMALALTTALHNLEHPEDPWRLDAGVAGTGTINPDGTIGPVGGVPAKAQAAKAAGVTTFLYPAGLDNATTIVGSGFSARAVVVEMQAHCKELGITCRPAAHLRELLAAAAHVILSSPEPPVTGTSSYAEVLRPSVQAMVDTLDERVAALEAQDISSLAATPRARIRQATAAAATALAQSQDALALERYYLAATRSFQGEIQAGLAENLTAFYLAGRDEGVVTAAIASCEAATARAQSFAYGLEASGMTSLLAVAAAQERATQAGQLAAQARQAHANAFSIEDWLSSLHASTYCVARAGTAEWWGGLRDAFGSGPAIGDLEALATDEVEDAREMVTYAQQVLQGAPADAQQALQAAEAHLDAHRWPAALLSAASARTLATVAMQTGASGGGEAGVAPGVLAAARDAAGRAIAQARVQGTEPVLAVSLVELAADQDGTAEALGSLWTARALALLDAPAGGPVASSRSPGPVPVADATGAVVPALVMGAALGLALAGSLVAVAAALRRD